MTTLQETQGFKRERGFFSKSVIFFVILFSLSNNVFSVITQKAGTTLPVGQSDLNICISNIPSGPTAEEIVAYFETDCVTDNILNVIKEGNPTFYNQDWSVTYVYTITNSCLETTTYSIFYSGGDNEAPKFTLTTPSTLTGINSCISGAETAASFNPQVAVTGYTDNCTSTTDLIVSQTGTPSITGDDKSWTLTYTYTVADKAGIETPGSYTVTGGDNIAPARTTTPLHTFDFVNACYNNAEAIVNFDKAKAVIGYSDNCGGTLTATLTDSTLVLVDNKNWTITYTYSIKDQAGNILPGLQYIVKGGDITLPALTSATHNFGFVNACFSNADASVNFDKVNAIKGYTDNCGVITASATDSTLVLVDNKTWTITYTYSIKDQAENTLSGLKYTVTGGDITAPLFSGTTYNHPVEINACYNGAVAASPEFSATDAVKSYNDNCGGELTVKYEKYELTGTDTNWTLTYFFTLTDQAGNVTNGNYTVKGGDRTPPALTGNKFTSSTLINACFNNALNDASFSHDYAIQGYSDLCGGEVTATPISSVVTGDNKGWTVTHTYNLKDIAGNTIYGLIYNVSGKDQTAPNFGTVNNIVVDGTSNDKITQVTNWLNSVSATDACGGAVSITNNLVVDNIDWNKCQTLNVIFTATDFAGNVTSTQKTLIISSIQLTGPTTPFVKSACEFADDSAIEAAYEVFKSQFNALNIGCAGKVEMDADPAPDWCGGGTVIVTLTVSDAYFTKTISASFTVKPCYITDNHGIWTDPLTWKNGCVPSNTGQLKAESTIIVNHDVSLDADFTTGNNVNKVTLLIGRDRVCTLTIDGNFQMEKNVDIQIFDGSAFQLGKELGNFDYCSYNTGTNFTVNASNLDPKLTIHENATFTVYGDFTVNNKFDITVKAGGLFDVKGTFVAKNTAEVGFYGNELESFGMIGCDMNFLNSGKIFMVGANLDVGGDLWFGNTSDIYIVGSTLTVGDTLCSDEGDGSGALVTIHNGYYIDGKYYPYTGTEPDATIVIAQNFCASVRNPDDVFLPIELLSFNAVIEGEHIQVLWQTASELNNNYFTIERSFDLTDWQVLGHVDGAGTVNEVRSYSFTDSNPESGINYYRLKQTDFDGAFEYFDPVAVNYESQEELEFEVLKNGSLWNVVVNSHEPFLLEVYTLTGRKIVSERGTYSIDFPNPVTGVVVRVISGTAGSSRVVM